MNKKALTAAIAASLAAPMAAQAVDFTISGHVNRGLFITDTDDASTVSIKNNGSSATRIRATGSGKLDTGHTAGIQLEYQEGSVRNAKGTGETGGLTLRHANVYFSGGFGKVTLGQGSEAADSGVYSDKSGLFGIGHGQDFGDSDLGSYFPSLDTGGRTNMIRYDTPSLGPVGIAVSAANNDQYSAKATLSMEMMGADWQVQLGYLKSSPGTVKYDYSSDSDLAKAGIGTVTPTNNDGEVQASQLRVRGIGTIAAVNENDGADTPHNTVVKAPDLDFEFENVVKETIGVSFGMKHQSGLTWSAAWSQQESDYEGPEWETVNVMPVDPNDIKPTYFQTTVGYVFGNNAVGLSWWDGKESGGHSEAEFTSIGVGFKHTMPKAGVELYAAVQNYDVTDAWGGATVLRTNADGDAVVYTNGADRTLRYDMVGVDQDDTVAVVGARVKF